MTAGARDIYEHDERVADPVDCERECDEAAECAFLSNDDEPFEREESDQQIAGILTLLGEPVKRVLELGSGAGRVLIPLAAAGHRCTGVDQRVDALKICETGLRARKATAALIAGDFVRAWPKELLSKAGEVDAVLCVGNTFMTIVDVDEAAELLARVKILLSDNGFLLMDAIAQEYWPELADGNWQAGVSEDGKTQLVWAEDDAVFALRQGAMVDKDDWELKEDDRKLRLWTMGSLRLAARAAGLSGPERVAGVNALIFRRG